MMSIPSSCTDDRVVRARRGTLSPREWQEFAGHLVACLDCRIAWRLSADFERSAAAQPGDERLIARGVKLAMTSPVRSRRLVVRIAIAASATLVAVGFASGAMLWRTRTLPPVVAPQQERPTRAQRARRSGDIRLVLTDPTTVTEPAPTGETIAENQPPVVSGGRPLAKGSHLALRTLGVSPARPTQEAASAHPPEEAFPSSLTPPPHPDGPAALFAEAVAERQQGRAQYSIASFRALERRFPDSREAVVSLISLGDLLLGTGSVADALTVFESYLLHAPNGTLVPEALAGKARALGRLGRATEAEAIRREIARRFPDFPYAQPPLGAGTGGTTP